MMAPAHDHSTDDAPSETSAPKPTVSTSRALLQFLQQGWSASTVQVGDRFRKPHDQFGKVWEVTRVWKTGDGLLHVRLASLDGKGETRIISVVTLMDTAYFVPVPPRPDQ